MSFTEEDMKKDIDKMKDALQKIISRIKEWEDSALDISVELEDLIVGLVDLSTNTIYPKLLDLFLKYDEEDTILRFLEEKKILIKKEAYILNEKY